VGKKTFVVASAQCGAGIEKIGLFGFVLPKRLEIQSKGVYFIIYNSN
jgi:hypothetical protein